MKKPKDRKLRLALLILIVLCISTLFTNCTSLNSNLTRGDTPFPKEELKLGEACSGNLFGGFSIPYVKETSINLTGSHSLVKALEKGDIKDIYVVEDATKSYFFYTKVCKRVYGR